MHSLIKRHDASYRLPALQCCKAAVDAVEADTLGDELVEQQPPFEIGPRQPGKVTRRAGVAVARPPDPLFLHQGAPPKGNIPIDVDLAEPYDFAAGPNEEADEATTMWAVLALASVDPGNKDWAASRERALAWVNKATPGAGNEVLALRVVIEVKFGDADKARALATACSISRCELTPTVFRNLRMLMFNASSSIDCSLSWAEMW